MNQLQEDHQLCIEVELKGDGARIHWVRNVTTVFGSLCEAKYAGEPYDEQEYNELKQKLIRFNVGEEV